MAFICTKPKGSCRNCEHYRYDEDYGGKACFAEQDIRTVPNGQPPATETKKGSV